MSCKEYLYSGALAASGGEDPLCPVRLSGLCVSRLEVSLSISWGACLGLANSKEKIL